MEKYSVYLTVFTVLILCTLIPNIEASPHGNQRAREHEDHRGHHGPQRVKGQKSQDPTASHKELNLHKRQESHGSHSHRQVQQERQSSQVKQEGQIQQGAQHQEFQGHQGSHVHKRTQHQEQRTSQVQQGAKYEEFQQYQGAHRKGQFPEHQSQHQESQVQQGEQYQEFQGHQHAKGQLGSHYQQYQGHQTGQEHLGSQYQEYQGHHVGQGPHRYYYHDGRRNLHPQHHEWQRGYHHYQDAGYPEVYNSPPDFPFPPGHPDYESAMNAYTQNQQYFYKSDGTKVKFTYIPLQNSRDSKIIIPGPGDRSNIKYVRITHDGEYSQQDDRMSNNHIRDSDTSEVQITEESSVGQQKTYEEKEQDSSTVVVGSTITSIGSKTGKQKKRPLRRRPQKRTSETKSGDSLEENASSARRKQQKQTNKKVSQVSNSQIETSKQETQITESYDKRTVDDRQHDKSGSERVEDTEVKVYSDREDVEDESSIIINDSSEQSTTKTGTKQTKEVNKPKQTYDSDDEQTESEQYDTNTETRSHDNEPVKVDSDREYVQDDTDATINERDTYSQGKDQRSVYEDKDAYNSKTEEVTTETDHRNYGDDYIITKDESEFEKEQDNYYNNRGKDETISETTIHSQDKQYVDSNNSQNPDGYAPCEEEGTQTVVKATVQDSETSQSSFWSGLYSTLFGYSSKQTNSKENSTQESGVAVSEDDTVIKNNDSEFSSHDETSNIANYAAAYSIAKVIVANALHGQEGMKKVLDDPIVKVYVQSWIEHVMPYYLQLKEIIEKYNDVPN